MSDLYEEIISRRSSLERLTARIPGFAEYLDRKALRVADQMLRDYVAAEMKKRIDRFAVLQKRLLDNGGLNYMSKTRSVKARMSLYYEHIKSAEPGYSGPFERAKIQPEELKKLYYFDEAQIRFADHFDLALNQLTEAVNSQQHINDAISNLERLAAEANESLVGREAVLTRLSKSV